MHVCEGVEEQEGPLLSGCLLNEGHRLGRQLGGEVLKNHRLLHHLSNMKDY
jgi:hypothetical protein